MRTLVAAALAGLVLAGQCLADPTPEERYAAARKVLKTKCGDFCGFWLGDDPVQISALETMQNVTQEWTVGFLESHPGLDEEKLRTELLNRHPNSSDSIAPNSVTRLTPSLYAFEAEWGQIGNVFLVGKRDGRWAVVWDIRRAETGAFSILKDWRTAAAKGCIDQTKAEEGCGALWGDVVRLKPDAKGRIRFAVNADYAQVMGGTVAAQFSIWTWDGTSAQPLFAKLFAHTLESPAPQFREGRITIWPKEEFKTFMAYGCCEGREVEWTLEIGADRVVDLGERPLYPEIDFLDEVFYRIWKRQPTDAFANPSVLAAMAAIVDSHRKSPPELADIPYIDYLDDFSIRPDGTHTSVCLAFNTVDQALVFDLIRVKRGWHILGLHPQAKVEHKEVRGRETVLWSEHCPHHGGFLPNVPPP